MNDPFYAAQLQAWERSAHLRRLPEDYPDGLWIRRGEQCLWNLSGNDYLGFAADQDAQQAAAQAAAGLPLTASSSRLLTGNHAAAEALEQDLAQAYRRPALLFNSGYHANLGLIPALFGKETLILADKAVHASMIDGIRLSAAKHLRFRHNDIAHLRSLIEKHQHQFRTIAILTESVFSMDGDLADLPALAALKREFPHIMLYVDEAHGFGVYGRDGLGVAQATDTLPEIDIITATFGKAAASYGAFAILSPSLKAYAVNRARTLIFSTALPAAQVAVSRAMFARVQSARAERERLHRLGQIFRQHLHAPDGAPHIVPQIIGTDADTAAYAHKLQGHGFYCLPIRPPTVPVGTARIRFSLNAALPEAALQDLLAIVSA
ncbi:MAG: 8-amino-7-oxononanoate synthase [Neisseria sp.]|nr:8-amino-7-oxononanoate synthase [Neisseria sp.]